MKVSNEDIARYYDTHQSLYSRFWSKSALHYGFWCKGTAKLEEAVQNTNRFLVSALSIESRDWVFDAGCGIGGTGIHIAEATGARVTGVTLSDVQLGYFADRRARSGSSHLIEVSKQDYARTGFRDATFSKIVAVESICHAQCKAAFAKEAFRILKPGGRIAIVDAFLKTGELTVPEARIYKKFINGWVVPNLASTRDFANFLAGAGFDQIKFIDMQASIEKSVDLIRRWSYITAPFNYIGSKLGLFRENLAGFYQKNLFRNKIAIYGVFVARKPRNSTVFYN